VDATQSVKTSKTLFLFCSSHKLHRVKRNPVKCIQRFKFSIKVKLSWVSFATLKSILIFIKDSFYWSSRCDKNLFLWLPQRLL
jgi:hypothetical protein